MYPYLDTRTINLFANLAIPSFSHLDRYERWFCFYFISCLPEPIFLFRKGCGELSCCAIFFSRDLFEHQANFHLWQDSPLLF